MPKITQEFSPSPRGNIETYKRLRRIESTLSEALKPTPKKEYNKTGLKWALRFVQELVWEIE